MKAPEKMPDVVPKLANYRQVAQQWVLERRDLITADEEVRLLDFGAYLDSFKTLSSEMELLALKKTLETYIEFYGIVKEIVDSETLKKCTDKLKANHSH